MKTFFAPFWLLVVLALPTIVVADDYRVLDSRLKVQVLATVERESLAQVALDRAGRLFLGGREAVFVVEPDDVRRGMTLHELHREAGDNWFMGLAPYGADLYVAKHNEVFVLSGVASGRHPATKPTPKRVVWGFPKARSWGVHQTLHDLKIGPDGKFYLTMGDLFPSFGDYRRPDHWSIVRVETAGSPAKPTVVGVGGLFRFDKDGSHFEQWATGVRNANGFDFNQDLDVFSADNDHESDARYVPGRLLFMRSGGFYNWPRGWMNSWPEEAPFLAGMGREVPVGLTVYGDSRFPDEYRDNVLVARWGHQSIDRYILTKQGSGYTAREVPWLICPQGKRPMAIAIGRGGKAYALVGHMQTNAESPVYTADLLEIDLAQGQDSFQSLETHQASLEQLDQELASKDFSRRTWAHIELSRRGEAGLPIALSHAQHPKADDPALVHSIRLVAQSRNPQTSDVLAKLAQHADSTIRYQAVLALANKSDVAVNWTRLLEDVSPRVQRASIAALRERSEPLTLAIREILAKLTASDDSDLRLSAALLLAHQSSEPLPNPQNDPKIRLGQALTDGFRLTIPSAHEALPNGLKIADDPYEDASAGGPRRAGLFTIETWWSALAKTESHEQSFQRLLKALDDTDAQVRQQSLRSLNRLADPRTIPALERLVDQSANLDEETCELAIAGLAFIQGAKSAGRLAKAFQDPRPRARRAAAEALTTLEPANQAATELLEPLRVLALDARTEPRLRAAALERLANVVDTKTLNSVLNSIDPQAGWGVIGSAARLAASKLEPQASARWLAKWLESPSEDARRAAVQAIQSQAQRRPKLLELARQRAQAESSVMVMRDLVNVLLSTPKSEANILILAKIAKTNTDLDTSIRQRINDRLREWGRADAVENLPMLPDQFAKIDWKTAWVKGDRVRGQQLFETKTGVSCAACHRFRGQGGQIGPSLEEADRRLTPEYLVESLLKPSAQVALPYQPWAIETKSGEVLSGLIVQETAKTLTLGLNDGTSREIPLDSIEQRKIANVSVMPENLVANPNDLRDLMAYLLTP